ncbi:MAG: ZPR1 zinc finger domain-containing protein [Methanomicrobiales archaeon]|nr:ZPR1 zinc finger domain-containing protein [Methanomicrobiales archaeon]
MRYTLRAPCPLCKKDIEYTYETEDIPYFSEILITTALCDCGFRHVDTLITGGGEPTRWKMPISSADDLAIRVIRSTSAVIKIPELGVTVEPGPACEGFISNVEGVLWRVMEAVEYVRSWSEGEDLARAIEIGKKIREALAGDLSFTLVLEDPCGNSAIIDKNAEKEGYDVPPEEAGDRQELP